MAKRTADELAEKRREAAERKRRSRERKLKTQDPEAYQEQQTAKANEELAKAKAEADKQAAADQEARDIAMLVAPLHLGLTTLIDVVAGIARRTMMPPEAPPLGHERADKLAEAWAPVLAPYAHRYFKGHNPLLLAAAGTTVAVSAEWGSEVAKASEAAEKAKAKVAGTMATEARPS